MRPIRRFETAANIFQKIAAKALDSRNRNQHGADDARIGMDACAFDPAATEPIGHRIIEVPENLERTELRDDTSGFIAYVPVGSLKTGKWFVTSGGDSKTVACAKCHGPGLRGSGNVPAIAGRSPSYIVRQLYDIQSGARSGVASRQMRRQVQKLNLDDMIAIAAFVSSLKP